MEFEVRKDFEAKLAQARARHQQYERARSAAETARNERLMNRGTGGEMRATQASDEVWAIATSVLHELIDRGAQTDISLLDRQAIKLYKNMSTRRRSKSNTIKSIQNARDARFANAHSIEGWDLRVEVGARGNQKMKSLYLGKDGCLYAARDMLEREWSTGIIIPEMVLVPGEVFPKFEYCEQVLQGLANIASKHHLVIPSI